MTVKENDLIKQFCPYRCVAIPAELRVADLKNRCNTNNATLGLAPKEYTPLTLISLRVSQKQPIHRFVHK